MLTRKRTTSDSGVLLRSMPKESPARAAVCKLEPCKPLLTVATMVCVAASPHNDAMLVKGLSVGTAQTQRCKSSSQALLRLVAAARPRPRPRSAAMRCKLKGRGGLCEKNLIETARRAAMKALPSGSMLVHLLVFPKFLASCAPTLQPRCGWGCLRHPYFSTGLGSPSDCCRHDPLLPFLT